MKVVLKADVKGTGKKDQMVEVSDGYARNFLLPRGLAVAANAAAVNEVKTKESAKRHHAEVELEQAQETARKNQRMTVVVKAKAGRVDACSARDRQRYCRRTGKGRRGDGG